MNQNDLIALAAACSHRLDPVLPPSMGFVLIITPKPGVRQIVSNLGVACAQQALAEALAQSIATPLVEHPVPPPPPAPQPSLN